MTEHSFWYWLGLVCWRYRLVMLSVCSVQVLYVVLVLTFGSTPLVFFGCFGLFVVVFLLTWLHAYRQEW